MARARCGVPRCTWPPRRGAVLPRRLLRSRRVGMDPVRSPIALVAAPRTLSRLRGSRPKSPSQRQIGRSVASACRGPRREGARPASFSQGLGRSPRSVFSRTSTVFWDRSRCAYRAPRRRSAPDARFPRRGGRALGPSTVPSPRCTYSAFAVLGRRRRRRVDVPRARRDPRRILRRVGQSLCAVAWGCANRLRGRDPSLGVLASSPSSRRKYSRGSRRAA